MDLQDAVERYQSLSLEQQVRFLALFGHNLTIAARDTYEFQSPKVRAPERLRAINEIQHRVLAHIAALTEEGDWRYEDETLLSICLDHEDGHLRGQTGWAFDEALNKVRM